MMERLLTSSQVADLLQIDPTTVRLYAQRGLIAGHKVGDLWRFTQADVQDYLRRTYRPVRPQTIDEWFAEAVRRGEVRA